METAQITFSNPIARPEFLLETHRSQEVVYETQL
jgi:hypothetical protein